MSRRIARTASQAAAAALSSAAATVASATVASATTGWHRLSDNPAELNLFFTLQNGQCFGWKRVDPVDHYIWTGVIGGFVTQLRHEHKPMQGPVLFRCINASYDAEQDMDTLRTALLDYFQLNISMEHMYIEWSKVDKRTRVACQHLPGMRVLRQDPVECLFSFICSSNNNITRIQQNVNSLRKEYGRPIVVLPAVSSSLLTTHAEDSSIPEAPVTVDGNVAHWYDFPTVSALGKAQEERLRELGLGYRARYVVETCKKLESKPNGALLWLHALRKYTRDEAQKELLSLVGVGPKVADCVALFSLDKVDCIPVDTHVFEIACRDYDSSLGEAKSMTPAVHAKVGTLFRDRFGSHAGWAHCVLFAAELPAFLPFMPEHMREQWTAERKVKRERKVAANAARAARVLEANGDKDVKKKNKKNKKKIIGSKVNTSTGKSNSSNNKIVNEEVKQEDMSESRVAVGEQQTESTRNKRKRKKAVESAVQSTLRSNDTCSSDVAVKPEPGLATEATVTSPVKLKGRKTSTPTTATVNAGANAAAAVAVAQAAATAAAIDARQARAARRRKIKLETY